MIEVLLGLEFANGGGSGGGIDSDDVDDGYCWLVVFGISSVIC